jgi:16S rRNA (adenine(1408)-N(1))-methyltransferase
VVVDLGTGDGRAVLTRAAAEPTSLVFGIDANAASMADASRRAARPATKGGLPNARFVVAAAETPPPELAGIADLVTVLLPWGSLLRGVLGRDDAVTTGIATLVRPGGRIEVLLAPSDRDGVEWPADATALRVLAGDAWCRRGVEVRTVAVATSLDLAAVPSTWARRLGLGRQPAEAADRRAWRLAFTKDGERR